ncbi:hypothetical protein EDB85DRAFT_2281256 [Lactarius pseudohatsudake]|nr:hypothetical protein EDB85DRAFT_2281256 [Lactarius pseudohatsudake]
MSEVYGSSWHGTHDGSRTRRFDAQDRDPGRRRDGDTQLNGGPAECPASDVTRVALEVGTQGILGGQARVESVQGTWADSILNVNKMASNLTDQVRSISEVTKAIALGDFSKQVEVDVQGEMLDLKMTVNSMVNQLSTLANEVTRVSLEVGTEGNLGGQAYVPDVQGMWKCIESEDSEESAGVVGKCRGCGMGSYPTIAEEKRTQTGSPLRYTPKSCSSLTCRLIEATLVGHGRLHHTIHLWHA